MFVGLVDCEVVIECVGDCCFDIEMIGNVGSDCVCGGDWGGVL